MAERKISDDEPITEEGHDPENPSGCKCGGAVCGPNGILNTLQGIAGLTGILLTPEELVEQVLGLGAPPTVPSRQSGDLWVYEVDGQQYLEVHTDYGRIVCKPLDVEEARPLSQAAEKALSDWTVEKAGRLGIDKDEMQDYIDTRKSRAREKKPNTQEVHHGFKKSSDG